MSRWKASALHLGISFAVVTLISALVLTVWYPLPLLRLGGIPGLISLIAAVDIVVGPLLTLVVFKAGKPGLKFDLFAIAFLQVSLLAYGLYALAANRPVFMVAVKDRFELVTARELADEDLQRGEHPYNARSWTGAVVVGVEFPTEGDEQLELIESAGHGRDIQHQPRYYRPLEASLGGLRVRPLADLLPRCAPQEIERIQSAAGKRDLATLGYVPITNAKRDAALMLMHLDSGEIVTPVDVDPWKIESRTERGTRPTGSRPT